MYNYEILTDMNVLYDAFQKCKKNTDWKYSVQKYEANLLANLNALRKSLINGTYRQKKFSEFDVCERGKTRHIKAIDISDRVLQRALCDNILFPAVKKYLIYDNGASQNGKGIGFSRKRLVKHLCDYYKKYSNDGYILLMDYHNFFGSIPHNKTIEMLRKCIKDERVIKLLEYLISTFDGDIGVGIGSQISQIIGIYYLTPVDNFCKIVKGCKYYGRYMDDLYVIHNDIEFLKEVRNGIIVISKELGLTLNKNKTKIIKINKNFKFLKTRYFVTETGKIVRRANKDNIVRERRKLKKLKNRMDENLITFKEIENDYKSWRNSLKEYDNKHAVYSMDKLFEELFKTEVR